MTDAASLKVSQDLPGHMTPLDGGLFGMTGFYRYPEFQSKLIDVLCGLPRQDEIRILVAGGSIGCEAVTLGVLADQKKLADKHGSLVIHSVDLSRTFTEMAVSGHYPPDSIKHLPNDLRAYFQEVANPPSVKPTPAALKNITYLPAQGLLDMQPKKPYDVVICANILQWVLNDSTRSETAAHMRKLCDLSSHFVCATLHFLSKSDVRALNFGNPSGNHSAKNARGLNTGDPFIKKGFHLLDNDWEPHEEKITRRYLDSLYGQKRPWEYICVFSR